MKKILMSFLLLIITFGLFGCQNVKTETNIETETSDLEYEIKKNNIKSVMTDYINSLISSTTTYIPSWNQEGFKGRWNYIDGVFLNSIVNLYEQTKDGKYKDFFINYINYYITPGGVFTNPKTNENAYRSGELDSVCASKILFDAHKYTEDIRYVLAITKTYKELTKMPKAEGSNNFWHKTNYPNQIWLDGMYMYVPFYARYANKYNEERIYSEIVSQYKYIRDHMFDEELGLYYHGHDTTKNIFWADTLTGNSKSFWLRSIGWYLVSLVDVLEYFPEGENKEYLKELLIEGINGVIKYINKEKNMLYQLVNLKEYSQIVEAKYLMSLKNTKYMVNGEYVDIEISNYLESSGSSMISYCLLKGSRIGIFSLDYKKIGIDIFEGVYENSFKNNELNDICITAGLGPSTNEIRDGSSAYYLAEPVGKNDAKGVGPFIMAYLEYIR